jgi:hypothetical protein
VLRLMVELAVQVIQRVCNFVKANPGGTARVRLSFPPIEPTDLI